MVYSRSRSKIRRVRGDIVSFFRKLSQKISGYCAGICFFVAFFAQTHKVFVLQQKIRTRTQLDDVVGFQSIPCEHPLRKTVLTQVVTVYFNLLRFVFPCSRVASALAFFASVFLRRSASAVLSTVVNPSAPRTGFQHNGFFLSNMKKHPRTRVLFQRDVLQWHEAGGHRVCVSPLRTS